MRNATGATARMVKKSPTCPISAPKSRTYKGMNGRKMRLPVLAMTIEISKMR